MELRKLWTSDRAVSPVVGVALMIAIAVILAAVIGGVVLGLGTSSAEAPQASLTFEDGDQDVNISHESGDPLEEGEVIVRVDGEADDFEFTEDLRAGETKDLDELTENGITLDPDDEVAIVWQDPGNGDETVIATHVYEG